MGARKKNINTLKYFCFLYIAFINITILQTKISKLKLDTQHNIDKNYNISYMQTNYIKKMHNTVSFFMMNQFQSKSQSKVNNNNLSNFDNTSDYKDYTNTTKIEIQKYLNNESSLYTYSINYSRSNILPILFEAFINFSENFYAYSQFWDRYNLKVSDERLSLFLCLFLFSMLTFPLIKPYLVFIFYIMKLVFYVISYIYCFFFNRRSKYFSLIRIYQQTFKRYMQINFYLSKSDILWVILNLFIYILFLFTNICFFIFFFIDLNKSKSATSIGETSTEVKVFKILATYFHLFIELYVLYYYLIDNTSSSMLNIYKDNEDHYFKRFITTSPSCALKTKLLYSLLTTISYFLLIVCFSFIVAIFNQDNSDSFNNNRIFFFLFKILCLIEGIVMIVLYALVITKFFNIVKLKLHWNNFLILKAKNSDYVSSKNINNCSDRNKHESISNNQCMRNLNKRNNVMNNNDHRKYSKQQKSKLFQETDNNEHKQNPSKFNNEANTNKYYNSTKALLLLEKLYLEKKLISDLKYNKKESSLNLKLKKQLKRTIIFKNYKNICNEVPYIMYYDTDNYNKDKLEVLEFYNTRSKYFYIKYVKYFSFPITILINVGLLVYTFGTLITGIYNDKNYISYSFFSYMFIRVLSCFQSMFVFLNTWVIYMKFEWRNLWLSD